MPHTKTGKYYKIVNGKRQYNPKYDRKPQAMTGRGSYSAAAQSTYKRTKAARKVAKSQGNYEPSLGRTLLTEGGSALGGLFGMPGLGKAAGGMLSNVFGLGAYEIKENVFMEGRLPQMVNMPTGGGTIIRFQEYLGDVITSATAGDFKIDSWLINPANRDTFPFLAQIAANYEQYQIEGLIFEYRSTSADALNSTNTALGSVLMATQYDVQDPVFASKAEMLNYEYSNSVKPSENCMHMIECAPQQSVLPILYTLDGQVPTGADARLYHLGRFQVATIGFQGASVRIGEIHMTYQVRLLKPKIYSSLGLDNDFALMATNFNNTNVITTTANSGFTYNNFNCSNGLDRIIIPPSSLVKRYLINVQWRGGVTTAVTLPTVTYSNASLISNIRATSNGTNCLECFQMFVIQTGGNNVAAEIIFSAATLPATPSGTTIRVAEVPSNAF